MAEEKDTAAPAKRTAGKTGRRKKPEAEHAARAAPQDKDTGSKAQEILEQARTEPKPEWEVAEQVVLLPLDRLRPFKNHPFKVSDEDELMRMVEACQRFPKASSMVLPCPAPVIKPPGLLE